MNWSDDHQRMFWPGAIRRQTGQVANLKACTGQEGQGDDFRTAVTGLIHYKYRK